MIADYACLRSALESFDGRKTAALNAVIQGSQFNLESLDALLSLIENEEENLQIGASWIILNGPEMHALIGKGEKERILEILSWDTNWQVALHFLQLFPRLEITKDEASEIRPVLVKLAEHKRPFVRAWAYNALYLAADRNATLRPFVMERLNHAIGHEKSSVRARIRNAIAKSPWFKPADQATGDEA